MFDMRCKMNGSDKTPTSARCRGAAMMLVLFAVAIASILALSFLRSQGPTAAIAANIDRHAKARALAESGLQLAIKYVKENEDWRTAMSHGLWLEDQGLSGGVFSVYGTDEDGDLADDDSDPLFLSVVATVNGVTHRVNARLDLGLPPIKLDVMFVVRNDNVLTSEETKKKTLFESWGYDVTPVDDGATQNEFDTAAALTEVVFISSDAAYGTVGDKLRTYPMGVVYELSYMSFYFNIAYNGGMSSGQTIEIIDTDHYVTSVFELGDLTVADSNITLHRNRTTVASGAQRLAEPTWNNDYALLVVETGADLLGGGTAPARRVKLPWTGSTDQLNANGRTLTRRALEWAAENEGGNGAQLLVHYEFNQVLIDPSIIAHWQLEETNGGGGGVAVGDQLTMANLAVVDSYDSGLGNYGGANITQWGTVSTNSNSNARIVLSDSAALRGSVYVGTGANVISAVSVGPSATMTGTTANLTQSVALPALAPLNNFPTTQGSVTLTSGNTVINSDTRYQDLTLSSDASITISGNIRLRIDGALTLENTAQIIVPSGSSLQVWAGSDVTLRDQARLNGDSSATDRLTTYVYNGSGDFTMDDSSRAGGLFYVSDDVDLNNQSQVYGSVQAGDDITLSETAAIHIDKAMQALVLEPTPVVDIVGGNDGLFRGDPLGAQPGATPLVGSGFSMTFDGNGDYIEMPHIPAYALDGGTFACWFRADTTSGRQGLFSKDSTNYDTGGHFSVFIENGKVRVRMQSTTASYWVESGSISNNTWYHIMFAWGAEGMVLYLDGIEVDTNIYSGGLSSTSGGTGNFEPIVLGGNAWTSDDLLATPVVNYFSGRIDDMRIYDERLTPAQALDLFNGSEPSAQLSEAIVEDTSEFGTPLNLAVEDTSRVTWSNGTLTFDQATVAQSMGDASKAHAAILQTGQFSIVLRFNRASPGSTANPSRIMSISSSSGSRNVTVGQEDSAYDVRVRTTTTGSNGILSPNFQSADVLTGSSSVHLVVTYDGTTLRTFRNGVSEMSETLSGVLTTWDATMPLLIGNEIGGGRAWLGTIDELAIYDMALSVGQAGSLASGSPLVDPGTTVKWDEQD